ncbi:hypothetical protein [Candidatus Bathycorpusculum sp.]|uniref:hypothetical protein n=1 Tax=Candidatus Bathycorpusculum sp. TaxID=2994959 RepID=UPI00282F0307|nr:hypothetical protein [Candidatus Termitimicrobium sp.]MCL2686767.1 hypothetical protein [Candidatus Termitimicrobium sp.]
MRKSKPVMLAPEGASSSLNQGLLLALFTTTTITEGVNTVAKNVLITASKKGNKQLKQFDAKNIAGRAGRFSQHYVGRVVSIDKNFFNIINGAEDVLNHKNYDVRSTKTDVDFQITRVEYLSETELAEKNRINTLIKAANIPQDVFDAFRIVGPIAKLNLYQKILSLSDEQISQIQKLSKSIVKSKSPHLYWDGFQLIMNIIRPIVKELKLIKLIDYRIKKDYSLITGLLNSFLERGYVGMVRYYTDRQDNPLTKDEAMRTVSDCVYNVFKYHLVKYLGLFDVFYRYILSSRTNCELNDVVGIGTLLQKLEYNAITPNARRLSDYGVPFNLVSYYDQKDGLRQKKFDAYEQYIDKQIQSLLD